MLGIEALNTPYIKWSRAVFNGCPSKSWGGGMVLHTYIPQMARMPRLRTCENNT